MSTQQQLHTASPFYDSRKRNAGVFRLYSWYAACPPYFLSAPASSVGVLMKYSKAVCARRVAKEGGESGTDRGTEFTRKSAGEGYSLVWVV